MRPRRPCAHTESLHGALPPAQGLRSRLRGQIAEKRPRGRRIAAFFGEARHLDHQDRPVERDGHDVADPDRMAGGGYLITVQPDMTGGHELGRIAARAHPPRMPKPFVDALPVNRSWHLSLAHDLIRKPGSTFRDHALHSSRLFAALLELLLEGGELGER